MIQDIRLHGFVANTAERYEYFTTVIGPGLHMRFFYEQGEDVRGPRDRFFLSGNEVALYDNRIHHRGNGGTFCEYMLGMEQPIKDILKKDVRNRLVMYGARYDDEGERIIFTNETSGNETLTRVFDEGHAFANYYFFIAGDIQGELKTVQETVLRFIGKSLKRSDLSLDSDGNALAARIYKDINIPRWTLFIVKLVDRFAYNYYKQFSELYRSGKAMLPAEREQLIAMSTRFGLTKSDRDRLELDVIQRQQENQQLIDGYKEALAMHYEGKHDERSIQFKRNRLRTLAARRHLPPQIFDKLDRMLRPRQAELTKPAFVNEAKSRLSELLVDGQAGRELCEDDLVCLLRTRVEALQQHYGKFDDLVTEMGRGKSGEAAELFSIIVGHYERFQAAYDTVISVAFIDDYELSEEQINELARAKDIIDNIRLELLDELIFQSMERQHYLNIYGRDRLRKLRDGIGAIITGDQQAATVIKNITRINGELRLRRTIDQHLRDRVRDIHKEPLGKQEQEFLRVEISHKLMQEGAITEIISPELFASALFGIREEFLYLNELLPQIINNRDRQLRNDFLENSELDRFRTEELEQQYFRMHNLSPEVLEWFASEAKH
jgi:uncharacterized protein (TIGR04442 family)